MVSRLALSLTSVLSPASTRLQRVVLVAAATFLGLAGLAGACVFLILRFRGLIKHWFHTPPGIPVQIEEVRVGTAKDTGIGVRGACPGIRVKV